MACRMLIVDDDPALVRTLERAIEERHLGEVVGTAADGVAAERAALELQPNVVLLDVLMPEQDGLQTMRNLKRQGLDAAYVLISQVTAKELVVKGYRLGAEYFIHKPIHLAEVEAVLTRVAERVQMKSALRSIQASLAPLAALTEAPAGAPARGGPAPEALRRRARAVLADLGVLGTAGDYDLTELAGLPWFRTLCRGPYALARVWSGLAEHYRSQPGAVGEPGPAAIEQRVRRAAATALSHLAAIGLEDFSDPRFERLAPTFFEFTEVRQEMNRLRTGKGKPGRVNLRKFLDAFAQALEEAGD